MSKRDPNLLIDDIIESAEKILSYTSGLSLEQFFSDSKTLDAVVRNFEIIGEAANKLPKDFKEKFQEIDWVRLRGFRNRLVHDYFGIDYAIIWNIKETYLPELINKLKGLKSNL
jgi:uncharacterized protein with HEPN domain